MRFVDQGNGLLGAISLCLFVWTPFSKGGGSFYPVFRGFSAYMLVGNIVELDFGPSGPSQE